jgi:integrase
VRRVDVPYVFVDRNGNRLQEVRAAFNGALCRAGIKDFHFHDLRHNLRLSSRHVCWRAPSERIRTASEIPIEADLKDEDAVPTYMKISEKVVHLRRLGMTYDDIAGRLGVNIWMAKRAARWGKSR